MKTLFLSIALSSTIAWCSAQNSSVALQFSETGIGGTARFVGMSGSFGALGADLSSLHVNPAGLGVFRKSQLTFSPTYTQTNTNSFFNKTETLDNRIGMKINNFGLGLAIPQAKDEDWAFVNIGISYSLLADFNNESRIRLNESEHSFAQSFAEEANGWYANDLLEFFPFSSGLAYSTYLIDPTNEDSTEFVAKTEGELVNINRRLRERGRLGETAISFGANYKQKLFLGATIGIQSVKYVAQTTHTETVVDEESNLNEFTFRDDLTISGSGVNLKLGTIYQFAPWIRAGLAWHSPTNINLTDVYSSEINTSFKTRPDSSTTDKFFEEESGLNEIEYRVITPSRMVYSAAFIIGNRGAINIDYETVNYANAKLKPTYQIEGDAFEFDDVNDDIRNILVQGNKLRIGGELKNGPWTVRGGFSTSSNPFNASFVDTHQSTNGFSLGTGYAKDYWFVDLAYSSLTSTRDYYPFATANFNEGAVISKTINHVIVTAGVKF